MSSELSMLLSVPEAARALSCSESTIYRLIRDGDLTGILVRNSTRISRAELEAFANPKREATS